MPGARSGSADTYAALLVIADSTIMQRVDIARIQIKHTGVLKNSFRVVFHFGQRIPEV